MTPNDLSKYVLAQNVSITAMTHTDYWHVTFDWLCPNCGQFHHATEYGCHPGFECMMTTLDCGVCYIRMPWARQTHTEGRDCAMKSVITCTY
jgi:hypothetical protein